MIYLTIEGQEMAGILTAPLVSGQVNFVDVKTIYDSTWDDLNKSYQFHNGDTVSEVDSNDEIINLPYEATAFPGTLEINVVGTKLDDDGVTVLKKATTNTLRFKVGCCNLDDNPDNCGDVSATVVEQIRQIAETAEDKATEAERISAVIWEAYRSGELNGKDGRDGKDGRNGVDGVSPTFETKQVDGGAEITINDVNGSQVVFLEDGPQGEQGPRGETGPRGERGLTGNSGANGKDGVSPTVSTTQTTAGAQITIKDATGTHTVELKNGTDGKDGADGKMSFEELTEEQKASLKGDPGEPGKAGADGKDGQAGKDGEDGYSPTAKVSQTSTGATITITDKNGTTTANIVNGVDGKDGSSGADGQPGRDGITPHIGDNGNWWIGDTDTGVSASGSGSSGGTSGGFIEKTLFDGSLSVTGANGTLTDSILNYDFALVTVCADLDGWGANSLMKEIVINTKNITFKRTSNTYDGFYDEYNSNGSGNWYRVCFGFVDETTITLGALTNGGNWKNAKIKKVTGYKINGGSSVDNYSTNETVVGTWIDGKPLYQKVVALTNLGTMQATATRFVHNIANVDNIWISDGYLLTVSTGIRYHLGSPYRYFGCDKTHVQVTPTGAGDYSGYHIYFILRYTKTTD